MKSYDEIKQYKKLYYLNNKIKLCNYSTNYYKYKKCNGEFTNEQISEQLKHFLEKYKKHNKSKDEKITIRKDNILICFD